MSGYTLDVPSNMAPQNTPEWGHTVSNRFALLALSYSLRAWFSGLPNHHKKIDPFDCAAASAALSCADRAFANIDLNSVGA